MQLYVDGSSGFPGGERDVPEGKKEAPAADGSDKALVVIKTPGRFEYHLGRDHKEPDYARFDVPEADPDRPLRVPEHVTVARTQTTTLRGADRWFHKPELMEAVKESSVIHARDLVLQRKELPPARDARAAAGPQGKAPEKVTFQEATARGPGWIDMADKEKK